MSVLFILAENGIGVNMREFIGNPISKEKLEAFEKIRDYAIAYCEYMNAGGNTCDFTDKMIDNVIDYVMKLKASRDYIYKYCGYEIPLYDEKGVRIETKIN